MRKQFLRRRRFETEKKKGTIMYLCIINISYKLYITTWVYDHVITNKA